MKYKQFVTIIMSNVFPCMAEIERKKHKRKNHRTDSVDS
jgi:hypothetical protein